MTTPARTLVDLSSRLDPYLLANLVDEGRIARLWTVEEVLATASRAGPRSGIRALRSILGERLDEPRVDSMLEGRVVRALSPFLLFETDIR